jgi:uncharacterized protein (DUF58 family)
MRAAVVALLLLAAYFRSGPLLFAVGVVVVLALGAHVWLDRVSAQLQVERRLESRLFFQESTTVTIAIRNGSGLPIPWLELHEALPPALILPSMLTRVLSLAPGQMVEVSYRLVGRRRGVHVVGPLQLTLGDVYGLARRDLQLPRRYTLIVYPRLLPAGQLELPALALFGDIRSRRPFLGDPARVAGVRPYTPGDPLHDMHWRATAATGTLQVKHYQPATTLQVGIFLNLSRQEYQAPNPETPSELAISIAATVASRLLDQRQEVGLTTNGVMHVLPEDGNAPSAQDRGGYDATTQLPTVAAPAVEPTRGRAHLMRLLEHLARLDLSKQGEPLAQLVQRDMTLPWGATAVVITAYLTDELLIALHRLRQRGQLVVVFLVEQPRNRAEDEARARAAGVILHVAWREEQFQAVAS